MQVRCDGDHELVLNLFRQGVERVLVVGVLPLLVATVQVHTFVGLEDGLEIFGDCTRSEKVLGQAVDQVAGIAYGRCDIGWEFSPSQRILQTFIDSCDLCLWELVE